MKRHLVVSALGIFDITCHECKLGSPGMTLRIHPFVLMVDVSILRTVVVRQSLIYVETLPGIISLVCEGASSFALLSKIPLIIF